MAASLVCVVDDDESVRESLHALLRSAGFTAEVFSSAAAFLSSDAVDRVECLILDVRMPPMSGPELQRELLTRGLRIPIVFITATSDPAIRSRVLRDGALDYIVKPFNDELLLDIVRGVVGEPD